MQPTGTVAMSGKTGHFGDVAGALRENEGKKTLGIMSFAKAVLSGRVASEISEARLLICKNCKAVEQESKENFFRIIEGKMYCGQPRKENLFRDETKIGCGCDLEEKVLYRASECPLKFWKAAEKNGKKGCCRGIVFSGTNEWNFISLTLPNDQKVKVPVYEIFSITDLSLLELFEGKTEIKLLDGASVVVKETVQEVYDIKSKWLPPKDGKQYSESEIGELARKRGLVLNFLNWPQAAFKLEEKNTDNHPTVAIGLYGTYEDIDKALEHAKDSLLMAVTRTESANAARTETATRTHATIKSTKRSCCGGGR